jgi:hypothetical protein
VAIVLKVLPSGGLGTEIADAQGECFDYALTLTLALAPWGCWGCILTRVDTGSAYLVLEDGRGQWSCECRDWLFRFRKQRSREPGSDCKHVQCAREFQKAQQLLASAKGR